MFSEKFSETKMKLFEYLGYKLGLQLNESEQNEQQIIIKEMQFLIHALPYLSESFIFKYTNSILNWHELTTNAYRIDKEAKDAFQVALASDGNHVEWNNAYRIAQEYDLAAQSLLAEKLRHIILSMRRVRELHLLKLIVSIFLMYLSIRQTWTAWSKLNEDQNDHESPDNHRLLSLCQNFLIPHSFFFFLLLLVEQK